MQTMERHYRHAALRILHYTDAWARCVARQRTHRPDGRYLVVVCASRRPSPAGGLSMTLPQPGAYSSRSGTRLCYFSVDGLRRSRRKEPTTLLSVTQQSLCSCGRAACQYACSMTTLCSSFRELAARVWKDRKEGQQLRLDPTEDTFTDTLLLELARRHP